MAPQPIPVELMAAFQPARPRLAASTAPSYYAPALHKVPPARSWRTRSVISQA